jgi:hypothetical protein
MSEDIDVKEVLDATWKRGATLVDSIQKQKVKMRERRMASEGFAKSLGITIGKN